MVVYMLAVWHRGRSEPSTGDVRRWLLGGLAATAAGVLILYPQLMTAENLNFALIELQGGYPDHPGMTMFGGFLPGAVVYAAVASMMFVRGRRTAAVTTAGGDQVSGEPASA